MSGHGCDICAHVIVSKKRTMNQEEFLSKATEIHGDKYDFSISVFEKSHKHVSVLCNIHGIFKIKPNNLFRGKGCRGCYLDGKIPTFDEVAAKFRETHGETYLYLEETYKDSKTKMKMICPEHGEFWQKPYQHCQGNGCQSCAKTGYKQDKAGTFYILQHENLTKIGITNRSVEKRIAQIRNNTNRQFKVFCQFNFQDGSIPLKLERNLLNDLNKLFKKPQASFDGSTECYIDADPWFVMGETLKLLENLNDNQK